MGHKNGKRNNINSSKIDLSSKVKPSSRSIQRLGPGAASMCGKVVNSGAALIDELGVIEFELIDNKYRSLPGSPVSYCCFRYHPSLVANFQCKLEIVAVLVGIPKIQCSPRLGLCEN